MRKDLAQIVQGVFSELWSELQTWKDVERTLARQTGLEEGCGAKLEHSRAESFLNCRSQGAVTPNKAPFSASVEGGKMRAGYI